MDTQTRILIIINQNRFSFERDTLVPQDFRDAVHAPGDYEVWRVVGAPDPEGQLPQNDVQVTGQVTIVTGQRYRVVPPGTFGLSGLPTRLAREVEEVRLEYPDVRLVEAEGFACVVFPRYRVPAGFSAASTRLLLKFPLSHPNGQADMFWTAPDLVFAGGRVPKGAEQIEAALGESWRRFSWHPQCSSPTSMTLRTYLEFVAGRLARGE